MTSTRKTRMSKEDRRLQILQSALDVFIENGYNKATTQGIADATGISEVTLFRYFDSKKEIFTEAIEPILISTLRKTIVASKDLGPIETLKYILVERLRIITKHNKVIKLILMENAINKEIANIDYIGRTSLLLKQSFKESGIKNGDDEFILRLLMGSILSFLYLPESDENKIEDFVDRVLDLLINKTNIMKEG